MIFARRGSAPAWLAFAALLLNTLWPLSADTHTGIPQDICSVNKSNQATDPAPASIPPGGHRLRHCALCLPASAHGALASEPGFPWLARLTQVLLGRIEAETAPPQRQYLHFNAQPRAPPPYI